MDTQLTNAAEEIKRLQRCINDLVSVLALPAAWSGNDPSRIVPSLLDALVRLLRLDLVYVRLKDPVGEGPIEMIRVDQSLKSMRSPEEICHAVGHWFGDDPLTWPAAVRKPIGNLDLSLLPLRLGLDAELGFIVSAAQRLDFPDETERLVLTVAANQAAIALHEARLLSQQKRLASELDERVAQRTRELGEAHAQVARSAERWRSVFDNSAIGVALIDLTGRFIATNPVYQNMLGYTGEELEQLSFLDITHEDYREHNWTLLGELLAGKSQQFQIETQYRRKNGNLVWLRDNVSFVAGSDRVPGFLMSLSEDITERKQAEEKLERSEAFLAQAQHLSRIGSYSWSLATDEITWSDELFRIYELGPPLTPARLRTRVHPEDLTLYEKMVEQARYGGKDFEWQYRLLMPDGSIKYLHAVAHATHNQTGRMEYIAAVQDVTERRRSQEALDKARSELARVARAMSLGTLTASITHEIRQPLAAAVTDAKTCSRWLNRDEPDVWEAREASTRLLKDLTRASEIISRIGSLFTKSAPKRELVDINKVAEEMIALLGGEAREHSISIHGNLASDLPHVMADRVQLQQVLMNLMLNGLDAMKGISTPGKLTVATRRDETGQVLISVADTGVGIKPEQIEQIFAPFFTSKAQGTGMGLTISRSIVEAHGGRLRATPHSGRGATFEFSMPIDDTKQQAA
jgi:PAS domain S-box-containing protein